jgi:CRISPR-associated protein Cas8a1/Csx13
MKEQNFAYEKRFVALCHYSLNKFNKSKKNEINKLKMLIKLENCKNISTFREFLLRFLAENGGQEITENHEFLLEFVEKDWRKARDLFRLAMASC